MPLFEIIEATVERARRQRSAVLAVVNLRILIGFAFLPAGLKKVLGQPFTDPTNVGAFHEFMHAFHATGPFYRFVGAVQLVGALLLMSQRFAAVGVAVLAPVLFAITVLCWSTAGIPTITTVTLMSLGVLTLLIWDSRKWRPLLGATTDPRPPTTAEGLLVDLRLWSRCGVAIAGVYLLASVLHGGVYRPRGVELDNPAFYVLPTVAVFPIITWLVDRSRFRRSSARG